MSRPPRPPSHVKHKKLILATVIVTLLVVLIVINFSGPEGRSKHRFPTCTRWTTRSSCASMGLMMGPAIVDGNKATELINGDAIFPVDAAGHTGRQANHPLRNLHLLVRRDRQCFRRCAGGAGAQRREGPRAAGLGGQRQDGRRAPGQDEGGGRRGGEIPSPALVQPGAPQQPHPPQAADCRWRRRVHRAASASRRCGPATGRTRTTGATRISASKGRWWRRCKA